MSYYLIAENIDDAWETLMEELYNQRDILHTHIVTVKQIGRAHV